MDVKITGIGYYLPDNIETSLELSTKINKSVDWIISRTGVKQRYISNIDVDKMGALAAKNAGVPAMLIKDENEHLVPLVNLKGMFREGLGNIGGKYVKNEPLRSKLPLIGS